MARAKKEELIEEELEEVSLETLQNGDEVATEVNLDTGDVLGEATIREINGKKYIETVDAVGSTFLEPLL